MSERVFLSEAPSTARFPLSSLKTNSAGACKYDACQFTSPNRLLVCVLVFEATKGWLGSESRDNIIIRLNTE